MSDAPDQAANALANVARFPLRIVGDRSAQMACQYLRTGQGQDAGTLPCEVGTLQPGRYDRCLAGQQIPLMRIVENTCRWDITRFGRSLDDRLLFTSREWNGTQIHQLNERGEHTRLQDLDHLVEGEMLVGFGATRAQPAELLWLDVGLHQTLIARVFDLDAVREPVRLHSSFSEHFAHFEHGIRVTGVDHGQAYESLMYPSSLDPLRYTFVDPDSFTLTSHNIRTDARFLSVSPARHLHVVLPIASGTRIAIAIPESSVGRGMIALVDLTPDGTVLGISNVFGETNAHSQLRDCGSKLTAWPVDSTTARFVFSCQRDRTNEWVVYQYRSSLTEPAVREFVFPPFTSDAEPLLVPPIGHCHREGPARLVLGTVEYEQSTVRFGGNRLFRRKYWLMEADHPPQLLLEHGWSRDRAKTTIFLDNQDTEHFVLATAPRSTSQTRVRSFTLRFAQNGARFELDWDQTIPVEFLRFVQPLE